jgi:hypothetical protein
MNWVLGLEDWGWGERLRSEQDLNFFWPAFSAFLAAESGRAEGEIFIGYL